MSLSQSIIELSGVGAALAGKLERLGIRTIQDLLLHFPSRYEDRTRITPIVYIKPYNFVVIEGVVVQSKVQFGRRRSLVVDIKDDHGVVSLRFFHFNQSQQRQFTEGKQIRCFGEVRHGAKGLELNHPEYYFLNPNNPQPLSRQLTPIYTITEGVSQARLRKLVEQGLRRLERNHIPLLLPESFYRNVKDIESEPSLTEVIRFLHSPPQGTDTDILSNAQHPMIQLLIAEEMLAHQLSLLSLKHQQKKILGYSLTTKTGLITRFIKQLPFQPTDAQQRCYNDIAVDLAVPSPMQRLLQGDVGSGKTLVACLSLLIAVDSGYQVVMMAPTEILAHQHFQVLSQWLVPLDIIPILLTGKMPAKQRRDALEQIKTNQSQVVIGTHALFQNDVEFANIALVIIDEQHRFGVNQRLALNSKGQTINNATNDDKWPHQLIMTATPIPRTLAMSHYGNLDCSIIDQLPPGRKAVQTNLIGDDRRHQVINRVGENCRNGVQAYWVCTLIEESETLQSQAAEQTAINLQQTLSDLNIGLIHGRLKSAEKKQIMQQFSDGGIDVLVATTVIEVGVDVPNASLMIIENPERLGLSQLHQLRGRVGRGATQSFCVLLYSKPLPNYARQRLEAMRDHSDGFKIAEIDLKLRGPGELLGVKQTGDIQFKIVDLQRDAELLPRVNKLAIAMSKQRKDSNMNNLIKSLLERWLPEGNKFTRT